MKYESVEQAVAALKQHQAVMAAYNHAMGVLYHDGSTAAPKDSWQGRMRRPDGKWRSCVRAMTRCTASPQRSMFPTPFC